MCTTEETLISSYQNALKVLCPPLDDEAQGKRGRRYRKKIWPGLNPENLVSTGL